MNASRRRLSRAFRRIVLAAAATTATACQGAPANDPDASSAANRCASTPVDPANDAGCVTLRFLPCGVPESARVNRCGLDVETCAQACASDFLYCQLGPASCTPAGMAYADATAFVECVTCPGAISGRRPRGLRASRGPSAPRDAGDYFASMAHLERASVRAFLDLAGWLAMHGAPPRLVRAAERAADDERRHARAATRLARRFGAEAPRVSVRETPPPTLTAMLADNAVEGCVNETYGALLATFQARHAADPRVRRSLRRIAADETGHADLAWSILQWGLPRLAGPARRRVRRAFERAIESLLLRASSEVPLAARTASGHPARRVERTLVQAAARLSIAEWDARSCRRARPRTAR